RLAPVLWRTEKGIWCCRFSHSRIVADDVEHPRSVSALQEFERAVENCSDSLVLEPGEVLLFNNRTNVHGRGHVAEGWSPSARWLVRAYANLSTTPINGSDPGRRWIAQ